MFGMFGFLRKKWSACSFVRYDRFQMKEIVSMCGLESKKASVCSVVRDSVCSVWNVRKIRYVRFQTKEIFGMFRLERKKASVCLVLQYSVGTRKLPYKSLPSRCVTAKN